MDFRGALQQLGLPASALQLGNDLLRDAALKNNKNDDAKKTGNVASSGLDNLLGQLSAAVGSGTEMYGNDLNYLLKKLPQSVMAQVQSFFSTMDGNTLDRVKQFRLTHWK